MEKFDAWLDEIRDDSDEFSYRVIYSAYLKASSGFESQGVESSSRRLPDGGYEIRAGRTSIVLADDAEREALAAYMERRYCGDRYPNTRAWESQQHDWYVEDLHNWTSDGWSGPG
ncbi:hypothetical protein ACWEOI_28950 [Nocardia sp. NPDC004340]